MKQATAWPGASQPCSVAACSKCAALVVDAALSVLGVTHVEEPAPVVVTEGEGE